MPQAAFSFRPFSLLLRLMLGLIMLGLGLAVILPFVIPLFFDPNVYKPRITTLVNEKFGLPIVIEGKIALTFFPHIGIKINNITLPQAPDFGEGYFLVAQELNCQVPWGKLIKKQLMIESLDLSGLTVNLIKQANGNSNWEYYHRQFKQAVKASQQVPTTPSSAPTRATKLAIALTHFTVENSALYYQDESQTLTIDKLSLQGLTAPDKHYPIKGTYAFSLQKTNYLFKGEGKVNATLSSQGISVDSTQWHTPELEATGKAFIPFDNNPITFNLAMKNLNLDALSKAIPPTPSSSHSAKIAPPMVAAKTNTSTSSRTIKGDLTIEQLTVKGMVFTNIKTPIIVNNALITLAPVTANFYHGQLTAQATHDMQQNQTNLEGSFNHVELTDIVKNFKHPIPLSGIANIHFDIKQLSQQPLQGKLICDVKNGIYQGVDIAYYLNTANALLKKESLSQTNTKQTPFDSLTATLQLHDNQIDNPDLVILATQFKVNGAGNIDLAQGTIDYKLQAWRQYTDNTPHPHAYPLAIKISGPSKHPTVKPDIDLYLKGKVKEELKQELNKQLEKGLKKLFKRDQ